MEARFSNRMVRVREECSIPRLCRGECVTMANAFIWKLPERITNLNGRPIKAVITVSQGLIRLNVMPENTWHSWMTLLPMFIITEYIPAKVKKINDFVNNAISVNPSLTPEKRYSVKVARKEILGWSQVKETASLRKIANEKAKIKKTIQPLEGFDEVEATKYFSDERDNLLIYKIDRNDQFVFKTSKVQMNIAKEMDFNPDAEALFPEECCFFNGNHKRVIGYTTLTASMYHPLLRRQVVHATMQCKHENTKFVSIFWKQFNEA